MTLNPFQKFLVLTFAGVIQGLMLVWTGIKVDAFALGLNENLYNIVLTAITICNGGALAMLAMLGLKAPTS